MPVTYTATTHNGSNVLYSWFFDDGTPAVAVLELSPRSRIRSRTPGIYYVTVTAVVGWKPGAVGRRSRRSCTLPLTANRPAMSEQHRVRWQRDGRLWVVNQDTTRSSAFDVASNQKLGEVNVGTAPRAVAVSPSGEVWVTNRQSASISVINPATSP